MVRSVSKRNGKPDEGLEKKIGEIIQKEEKKREKENLSGKGKEEKK